MKEQWKQKSKKILAVILMLCMVLQLPYTGFGVEAEEAATESQTSEKEYTEVTFSSYGIADDTYDGKEVYGTASKLTNMDGVAFTGKIKFGGDGNNAAAHVRIGGINEANRTNALGIFYNSDTIALFNHLDGGVDQIARVEVSDLKVNPLTTAVDVRLTFDYENTTDVRITFSVEGKEYYNGVLKNAVSKIGTYMVVASNTFPITVESIDLMADYDVLTFTDFGFDETTSVSISGTPELMKTIAGKTLHKVAVEGYFNFVAANVSQWLYIGGEKQGIQMKSTDSGNMYVNYRGSDGVEHTKDTLLASTLGIALTGTDVKFKMGFQFVNVNEAGTSGDVNVILVLADTIQREFVIEDAELACFNQTVMVKSAIASPLTIKAMPRVPMEGYTVKTFTDFGFEEVTKVSTVGKKISKSIEGSTLHKVAIEGYYNFYAENMVQFVYMGADEYGLRIESAKNGNIIARYRYSSTDPMRDLATFTPADLGITLTGTDVKIKTGFEFSNVSEDETTGDVKVTMLFADTIKREFTITGADLSLFNQTITVKTLIDQPLTIKPIVQEVEYKTISFTDLGYDWITTVENGESCKSLEDKSLDGVILQGYYNFSKINLYNVVFIGGQSVGLRLAPNANGEIVLHYRDDASKELSLLGTIATTDDLILTEKPVKIATGFAFSAIDEVANTGTVKFTITISDTYSSTHYLPNVSLDAFKQTLRIVSGAETAPLTIKDIATDGKDIQKVTFSDYGIKDDTYNGNGNLLYRKGALLGFEDLNCVEFSGKVIFGYEGTAPHNESVRIGGLTSSTHWNGIGVMYANNGIYLRNYLDGGTASLVHVPTSKLNANPLETAVEIKMFFVYVNDKQDVRLIFSIDGVEFYNDVIEGAAEKLGPYMVVSSQYTPMTVASVDTGTEQEKVDVEYYNLANVNTDNGYGYLVVGRGDILINGTTGSTAMATNGDVLKTPGDYDIRVVGEGEYAKKVVLYLSGDAHPDGTWDVRDLVAVKKVLCGVELETEAGTEGADVDRNGIVDVTDYNSVCNHLIDKADISGIKDSYVTYEKDVMPIAGYFGPYRVRDDAGNVKYDYLTDNIYDKIKSLGINLICRTQNNYAKTTDETEEQANNEKKDILDGLALAEKKGLGVYLSDARISAGYETLMAEYANYSSFKGLSIVDEPDILGVYGRRTNQINLAGYSAQAKTLNSYCNTSGYINLLAMNQSLALKTGILANDYDLYLETYIENCNPKVLSWDYYVFDEGIVNGTFATVEGYFTNLSVMRDKAMKYNIPFWSYVQAGSYWNEGGGVLEYKEINTPTKQQLLWNVNTALAYGAKGIQYFPLIQPHYFATDNSTDDGMDYTRNGLIGANGVETQWYGYAQTANEQIREVDEVLLRATSKAVLAVGDIAQDKTGITTSSYGKLQSVVADNGAIVGVFDYQGKTAYYVVNYDTTGTSATGVSSTITLNFDNNNKQTFKVVSKQLASETTTTDTSCTLKLVSGGAALVIAE